MISILNPFTPHGEGFLGNDVFRRANHSTGSHALVRALNSLLIWTLNEKSLIRVMVEVTALVCLEALSTLLT